MLERIDIIAGVLTKNWGYGILLTENKTRRDRK